MEGDVVVRTFLGDLSFRDLTGVLEASSAEGTIEAYGLTGSARLRTGDGELWVGNSSAVLELETVRGEIQLDEIDSPRISATSTGGEIDFSGSFREGGAYSFFSHGGDIHLRLAPPVNFKASVLAYEGEIQSDFPIRANGFRSGEVLEFTVGTGGARLVVETFEGTVELQSGSSSIE
jgi:hypothetical protein